MEKYLIELSVDKSAEHHIGQGTTRGILSQAGVEYKRAKWYSASSSLGSASHTWKVECTDEERAYLVLLGAKIGKNLTAEARVTAQSKLASMIETMSTQMSTFTPDEMAYVNSAYMLAEKVQAITCLTE